MIRILYWIHQDCYQIPSGFLLDFIRILLDSIRTLSRFHQDSQWIPSGLLVDSIRILSRFHQDSYQIPAAHHWLLGFALYYVCLVFLFSPFSIQPNKSIVNNIMVAQQQTVVWAKHNSNTVAERCVYDKHTSKPLRNDKHTGTQRITMTLYESDMRAERSVSG